MAKTTPPADERQAPDELATAPQAPPGPRFWRYSGPERVYADIPVTVQDGDVIEYTHELRVIDEVEWHGSVLAGGLHGDITKWHTEPAWPAKDGCWEPCDGPATVHPDNHSTTDSAGE